MPVKKAKKSTKKTTAGGSANPAAETFQVKGEELLRKVKELINEGNVRKITILDKTGGTILSIPVTVGVVGVIIAPFLAAVGAMAALITECTIKVERK